jgi:aryl-alcohol dehydrogenase-like predicted oxidoreductase
MIQGRATSEGTARCRERFAATLAPDHFQQRLGLWLSSIGLGTYLGEPDAEDDRAYERTAGAALLAGCNVLDTAINYRFQRSERSLGAAFAALIGAGRISRDEFVVATKGGFIPFDADAPSDPQAWIDKTLIRSGVATPQEIVAGCHCMAPKYIDHQFEASRANLGLETIDIYYVHNPETQLETVGRSEFLARLQAAFEILERKAREGKLGVYGVATWDGLRTAPAERGHLPLAEIVGAAERAATVAGSRSHHFGAVQLPLNLAMPEAILKPTQTAAGEPVPLLAAAAHHGLVVMASASILQGHLIRRMPAQLSEKIPGGRSLAQKAIQWVRSAPGLTTALVGMKSLRHLEENLGLAAVPRMTAEEFRATITPRRS